MITQLIRFVTVANLAMAVSLGFGASSRAQAACTVDCVNGGDAAASCGGNFCGCTADATSGAQCHCTQGISNYEECAPFCLANGQSCALASECCSGICNLTICSDQESPILIDIADGDPNYNLTSAQNGVLFDIDADGRVDRVAWTRRNSEVGFLCSDLNGNGSIDNGAELFGTATRMRDGTPARNGFEALIDLEGGLEASDGQIDTNDPSYAKLKVWLDRNHNGVSEGGELLTLRQAGVTVVFTDYRMGRRVDRHGNQYLYVGSAMVLQGRREVRRRIFDVMLIVQ